MRLRRSARIGCGAVLAVVLTGCAPGEPSSDGDTPAEGGAAVAPAQGVFGTSPAASSGIPSVILLTPNDAMDAPATQEGATIDQFGLTFSPTAVITPVGESVVFTNSEAAVAHNVRVRAMGDTVDLLDADANAGERLSVQLSTPGGYDVLCDMHPGMTAFLFASTAPWSVLAEPDGGFVLDGVPPGTYSIQLWTAAAGYHDPRQIEVAIGATRVDLMPSG